MLFSILIIGHIKNGWNPEPGSIPAAFILLLVPFETCDPFVDDSFNLSL